MEKVGMRLGRCSMGWHTWRHSSENAGMRLGRCSMGWHTWRHSSTVAARLSRWRQATVLMLALSAGLLLGGGCSEAYIEGQTFEEQKRFEQALAAYKEALAEDLDDDDLIAAVTRTSKKAARQHFKRYQDRLAQKAFAQAFAQLRLTTRADPQYDQAQTEAKKWWQVLIIGHITIRFSDPQSYISQASSVRVLARINTPQAGRTLDALIDLDQGIFFSEDILYQPDVKQMASYTLQSLGVETLRKPNAQRNFTLKEHLRFISFRTPALRAVTNPPSLGALTDVGLISQLRQRAAASHQTTAPLGPVLSVKEYSLDFAGKNIRIQTTKQRGFTPQLLQIHPSPQKILVDFGAYQLELPPGKTRWHMRRNPLQSAPPYYRYFAKNLALRPYFLKRGVVFAYP